MVRILTGADSGVKSTLVMPTDRELRTLARMVYAKYPFLDTRERLGDAHDAAFRRTFWGVGWLGRRPEIERKNVKGISWWCGYLTDLLRDHGIEYEIDGQMFGAAVIAHGDVPHTIGARWPFDVIFGLTYPHAGRAASDKWTTVLSGAIVPPSPLPYPITPIEIRRDANPRTIQVGLVNSTVR
jgi:hypothetical protein